MKTIRIFLISYFLTMPLWALSGQEYMQRFTAYINWSEQLPETPSEDFLHFIQGNTPLSKKLRAKWLYQLARNHDWAKYNQYYQPSLDANLVCLSVIAQYELDKTTQAEETAKTLWLTGDTQPPVCNQLFKKLLQDEHFDEQLITKRIKLALSKRNLELALWLLKQYKIPRQDTAKTLQQINTNPGSISALNPDELQSDLYLYGLKLLAAKNMNQAVKIWNTAKTQSLLHDDQKQDFLTFLTVYKAMRNNEDAALWFKKIKPAYYNNVLLEWQIRYALKNQNWKEVQRLIQYLPEKDNPCWQYWLARSLAAQGHKEKARAIFESLSAKRNYYGFLASAKLNQKPAFENEDPVSNPAILIPYQPFLKLVENLYNTDHTQEASRLLNDFMSELPKEDSSALVYWIANNLQWHGKSIDLSSNEALNNQLALRFPLAYQDAVQNNAKKYKLPTAFIFSIIRQESGFRNEVTSSAGAKGLMQLMPATASMVAKKEKIAFSDPKQLFVTDKNITLGAAYLSQLYKRYNQHLVLVAAAYNAGPKRLNYWLANHSPKQMDIWIETLPWQETRNYLKNMVAFYTVYQYRTQVNSNLKQIMRSL